MTSTTRAGRLPALLLTVAVVALAALALTLGSGGGSSAAPAARPAPTVQHAAAHTEARATATPVVRRHHTARTTSAHQGDSPAQMYLDDTDERRGRLIHDYDLCLLANGARENTTRAMAVFQGTGVKPVVVQEPVPAAASKACEAKLPLLPKEEDPSLNPDYVADSAADVQCLRDHGIAVHTVADHSVYADGLSWTYDNDHVVTPDDEAEIERACMIAAFSDQ